MFHRISSRGDVEVETDELSVARSIGRGLGLDNGVGGRRAGGDGASSSWDGSDVAADNVSVSGRSSNNSSGDGAEAGAGGRGATCHSLCFHLSLTIYPPVAHY